MVSKPIGSKPNPRDPKTEAVRDKLPKGNPFAKKYGQTSAAPAPQKKGKQG
jgi:hypothetical protein